MSGDSESLSKKRKHKIALAELKDKRVLGQLNASQPPPDFDFEFETLHQARAHPEIALEDVLWSVECFLWNGERLVLYTSKEEIADECRTVFGWKVDKEASKPTYKYSKSFYEWSNIRERFWRQWIDPWEIGQPGASFMKSETEEVGQPRLKRMFRWEHCPVQRGLGNGIEEAIR